MVTWNCATCDFCTGQSMGRYEFDKDLKRSITPVEEVVNDITKYTNLIPVPTDVHKSGDIVVKSKVGKIVARVEVKLITNTF